MEDAGDRNPEEGLVQSFRVFGFEFHQYSLNEIKELSVKEITNPQSCDSLLNCNHGGLYDPNLGTLKPGVKCEKCRLFYSCPTGCQTRPTCPGHMGSISLPLPVFNPVNFQTMFRLLKWTCFDCHVLIKQRSECYLFLKQMQALDYGLIVLLDELDNIYKDIYDTHHENIDNLYYDVLVQRLGDCLSSAIESNSLTIGKSLPGKHAENLRHEYYKKFWETRTKSSSKGIATCRVCKLRPKTLRHEQMGRIFFGGNVKQNPIAKKKFLKRHEGDSYGMDVDLPPDKDAEIDPIPLQNIITPLDAKLHLRLVWEKDRAVVERISGFHCSLENEKNEYPTDKFFVETVLVAPSRTRPMMTLRNTLVEHAQTANLKFILVEALELKELIKKKKVPTATLR